jgi:hypothetical protein
MDKETLIFEISATINEILEFRGIDDNGKNFNEDVEKHIIPLIDSYIIANDREICKKSDAQTLWEAQSKIQ